MAEYNRIKRLRDIGADPVTGGARLSLSDLSQDNTQQITYDSGGGDSGGGNQFAFASPGQIGFYNPNINPATGLPYGYQYGTYSDYAPFAQVKDGGIIGLDNGGYINDYQAADSLMFKDPQEEEEWEYNV